MKRKQPTHIYIVECYHFTKRGAVLECYTGISNNPRRRIQEHVDGRGARCLRSMSRVPHRVAILALDGVVQGIHATPARVERQVKRLPAVTKQAIVTAAFTAGSTLEDPALEKALAMFEGDFLWRPFWQQCHNQCLRVWDRSPVTGKMEPAAIMSHRGGGFDCNECHGQGGVFIE